MAADSSTKTKASFTKTQIVWLWKDIRECVWEFDDPETLVGTSKRSADVKRR